mmetsp:Transcript_136744/g.381121  ORF Transcript_136744/g.381121 Transcript_136744/m.381121 type:complete len:382 (+) Transcript_136744:54-1199(+)
MSDCGPPMTALITCDGSVKSRSEASCGRCPSRRCLERFGGQRACPSRDVALIDRDHVLDVDERILAAVDFEDFQRLLDEVAQVQPLALGVVHLVANIQVLRLEYVQHGKDLPVVGHQRLTNHIPAEHKRLHGLQDSPHDLWISCVQGGLDGYDELWHNRQDLRSALFEHVVGPLNSQEAVRVLLFAEAIEEDGQVVVVVQLLDLHLPDDLAPHGTVEDLDRHVPAVVKAPELRFRDGAPCCGPCARGRARRQRRDGPAVLLDGERDVLVDAAEGGTANPRAGRALRHHARLPLPPKVRGHVVGRVVAKAGVRAPRDQPRLLLVLDPKVALLVHHRLQFVFEEERPSSPRAPSACQGASVHRTVLGSSHANDLVAARPSDGT